MNDTWNRAALECWIVIDSRCKINDFSRLSPDTSLILRPRSSKKWYAESFTEPKVFMAIRRKVCTEGMSAYFWHFLAQRVRPPLHIHGLLRRSTTVGSSYVLPSVLCSLLSPRLPDGQSATLQKCISVRFLGLAQTKSLDTAEKARVGGGYTGRDSGFSPYLTSTSAFVIATKHLIIIT